MQNLLYELFVATAGLLSIWALAIIINLLTNRVWHEPLLLLLYKCILVYRLHAVLKLSCQIYNNWAQYSFFAYSMISIASLDTVTVLRFMKCEAIEHKF